MSEDRQDGTALWHPFADMFAVEQDRMTLERGEGVWVHDDRGRRYLDGTASLWYCNVGHGRQEIVDAVAEQMRRLEAYSTFGDLTNAPAERLAHRLAELAPMDGAKIFLTSGGGEAIDTAAKLARRYWVQRGAPERTHLLSRGQAYHGTNGFGTALGGIAPNREGFGELIPGAEPVVFDDAAELRAAVARIGPENIAAFFAEPVIGAGGVHPPPAGFLESAAAICRENGILFIADAVICGFGRVGDWFGVERWGLRPDMITFAKGVTSGYLPLGGVAIAGEVAEPFFSRPGVVFRHGPTYAGHPAAAAAALANVDILRREQLPARVKDLEAPLHEMLRALQSHPAVREVRGGTGLLGAVELQPDLLTADSAAVSRLVRAVRAEGVLVRGLGSGAAVSPPLTIDSAQIELIGSALRTGLDALGN
ncbi:aspartate aminotransferase family protein [Salinifilum aidingensis]